MSIGIKRAEDNRGEAPAEEQNDVPHAEGEAAPEEAKAPEEAPAEGEAQPPDAVHEGNAEAQEE